jgi:Cu/Ag efflux protein CusF
MVDLKQEGSDETNSFLAWDYNLLNEAARLKEGDKVFFKTDLKNGKKQLSELRAAAIK